MYSGSVFVCHGCISSIVAHTQTKMYHILTFILFVKKNTDIPSMFEAVLDGCESWMNGNLIPGLSCITEG